MNRRLRGVVLSTSILLLLALQFSGIPTYGDPVPGVLHGTTLDASGQAVPQAVVRLRSTSDSADRIVTSDARGNFLIEGLVPGRYQLVASKKGFEGSQVVYLAIGAGDLLTFNMRLGDRTEAVATETPSSPAAAPAADPSVSSDLAKELEAMKERIEELEAKLKATSASEQPATAAPVTPEPKESSSVASAIPQGQAPAEPSTASGQIPRKRPRHQPAAARSGRQSRHHFPSTIRGRTIRREIKIRRWLPSTSCRRFGSTRTTSNRTTSRRTTPWGAQRKASGTVNSNWSRRASVATFTSTTFAEES